MAQVSANKELKDLLEQTLNVSLDNAKDIAVIRQKCEILDKLETSVDDLAKEFHQYELSNNQKINELEIIIAHLEEKVSHRATIITLIGAVIATAVSFLVAFFFGNK